ncbi:hypothetical protein C0Q70_14122 [Pomacea canaliculata]|uniref:Uncharacterized protein n=1 Tax=Pomacea canaliculata TaxID=400727 RepID=A0A2T7NZ51_POMCA|nr:hypothetical protein C0Q70_14122 [Pomacea canaliculata]
MDLLGTSTLAEEKISVKQYNRGICRNQSATSMELVLPICSNGRSSQRVKLISTYSIKDGLVGDLDSGGRKDFCKTVQPRHLPQPVCHINGACAASSKMDLLGTSTLVEEKISVKQYNRGICRNQSATSMELVLPICSNGRSSQRVKLISTYSIKDGLVGDLDSGGRKDFCKTVQPRHLPQPVCHINGACAACKTFSPFHGSHTSSPLGGTSETCLPFQPTSFFLCCAL